MRYMFTYSQVLDWDPVTTPNACLSATLTNFYVNGISIAAPQVYEFLQNGETVPGVSNGTGWYYFDYATEGVVSYIAAWPGLTTTFSGQHDSAWSAVGTTLSSIGDTLSDPTDVYGLAKRVNNLLEGGEEFTFSTGKFDMYAVGSSTLLRSKTITDVVATTTRN